MNKATPALPRLSASRLRQMLDCSWAYWCVNYLKLPEAPHPKTICGNLVHLIFEVLKNPRHKKHYNIIVKNEDIYSSKAVSRLIKRFKYYNSTINDTGLNEMVLFGLNYDFFHKGCKKLYPPEYEFNFKIGNNTLKGFIDVLAIYKDYAVVRDFKTSAKKFKPEELENNVQAMVYAWAVWKIFRLPCRVEFVMLRSQEIQIVEPFSEKELKGIEDYLNYIESQVKNFDENSAKTHYRATTNEGFCSYVCQFKNPREYYAAFENGQLKETSMDKDKLNKYSDVRLMRYCGCPFWYNSNGQKRNFN